MKHLPVTSIVATYVDEGPRYCDILRRSLDKCNMTIRGKNGLADQARLPASTLEAILRGDRKPTYHEHKAILRGLPGLKREVTSPGLFADNAANRGPMSRTYALPSTASDESPPLDATSVPVDLSPGPEEPLVGWRTFGPWLRFYREREQLTQAALGELCNVTGQAVGLWEDDTNNPVQESYEKLIELFPALADKPQPNSQDILTPVGRGPDDVVMMTRILFPLASEMPMARTPVEPTSTTNLRSVPPIGSPDVELAKRDDSRTFALINLGKTLGQIKPADLTVAADLLKSAHAAGIDVPTLLKLIGFGGA